MFRVGNSLLGQSSYCGQGIAVFACRSLRLQNTYIYAAARHYDPVRDCKL